MSDLELGKQNLYRIQAFLFDHEDGSKNEDDENRDVYIKVLKLLANEKGLHFISDEFNNPEVTFDETLKRWNPVLTFLISEALSNLEPDKKHRLFQKKISDMTGYEYRDFMQYLKEETSSN